MSNYTQITNFSAKDALASGDPGKKILGSDVDAELAAVATAINSKLDSSGDTDLAVADGGTGASTAAGARTNLGLGTIATQNAASVEITGGSITGITDLAVADGGTGASTAADARTNLGLGALATLSAVSQGTISTALQQNTGLHAISVVGRIVATGGTYTFHLFLGGDGSGLDYFPYVVDGAVTGYNTTVFAWGPNDSGGERTYYLSSRYIQASPPYDLGDGEIPLFVFAEVTPGGRVVAVDVANDPPWAYNGPTCIRPDAIRDGKKYRRVRQVLAEHGSVRAAMQAGLSRVEFVDRMATDPVVDVEITPAMKNADMPLIPHPFVAKAAGNQVVLLDPVSPLVYKLSSVHGVAERGETIGELLMGGDLRLDNSPLTRSAPPGVLSVGARFR